MTLADERIPDGAYVEKHTGEARWLGHIASSYLTRKGKLRYVVEVEPQGFQMIAVPSQLRVIDSPQALPEDVRGLVERLHYAMKHIAFEAHRENALQVMSEASLLLATQQDIIQEMAGEVERLSKREKMACDAMRNMAKHPCRHTRALEQETDRADIKAWQADQREFFNATILEIVSEYAAWRDTLS